MRITILIIFISISLLTYSQNTFNNYDSRLLMKYSESYLFSLQENNPDLINYLNFTLDNSCEIIDITADKIASCPYLYEYDNTNKTITENTLSVDQLENINIYKYNFEQDLNLNKVYRIKNSDNKAIVFISKSELAKRYNNKSN